MNLHELKDKYNLDFTKLGEILKKRNIILKLEHLSDIPVEWIPIIEKSLGLVTSKKYTEKIKAKELTPRSIKNTKNVFYAYVKYVGPDLNHAFIKRIDDINGIESLDLRLRDDADLTIKEDCSNLQRNQIILCEIISKKYHSAKIITDCFKGTILNIQPTRVAEFIDWLSFNTPIVINNIRTFGFGDDDGFVATKLHFVESRLRCKKIELEVDHKEIIHKIEKIILPIISKRVIEKKEKKFIEFYKSNVESSSYDRLISKQFEKELNIEGNFSNETNLITFFNKWRILNTENLVLSNIKHKKHLNLYVKLWLDYKIDINF